ncbi:enolase C-terminal domain-like protein [Halomonas sp. AOP43-D1-39]|uniref:enolase C-terminal domain-like protein n=1 Tax=Halomonas sp. AOP43-D1-39 TaxID=3457659 RepID=UPI004033D591
MNKILKAECYKTVVPLKRPFSTSRFTSTKSTNYIVRLECDGVVGIGEAAARGYKLTGDYKKNLPIVIEEMLEIVAESAVDFSSKDKSISSIKSIYSKLENCAILNAKEVNKEKPFRGILSGFDIALLDLAAKKLNITVSDLLGENRENAFVSASTLSASKSTEEILDRLRNQAKRFTAFRCKGAGDNIENLRRLSLMRQVNKELSKDTAYWLDLNEALTPEEAVEFIHLIIDWMEKDCNKHQLMVLEQPVPKKFVKELCSLQQLCDDLLPSKHGKIAIMADESLWDLEDFKQLISYGGCSAINIKIPKVGGLIKALELGDYAYKYSPDTIVYIGGMIGTSDIMGRAIYNLYKALPKIDFCTTSPARNVQENLASSSLNYISASSSEVSLGLGSGIGTDLDYGVLEKYKEDFFIKSEYVASSELALVDNKVNTYNNNELLRFSPKELDNHLIEREALLLGLTTVRSTETKFSVVNDDKKITFSWTVILGLPKKTRMACKEKAVTKEMFRLAGAPVAEGQVFQINDDYSKIISYAEKIGWPVVVKPGVGTGGVGVTANITNSDELLWAIRQISSSKVASQRNDGTFILEKHISGKELRVLVADGKAVNAVERIQPHVTGDGVNTIRTLIDNKNILRSKNPNLSNSKLKKGTAAKFQLSRQGKTFESIPKLGEVVTISPVFSISQGADSRSVINSVHESVLDAAVKAVNGVDGLYESGVDFILEDYTKPINGQQACVCEVNTSPAISSSHFPMYGQPVNVAHKFLCSVLNRKWPEGFSQISKDFDSSINNAIFIEIEGGFNSFELKELCKLVESEGVECNAKSYRFITTLVCKGDLFKMLPLPSLISKLINTDSSERKIASYLFEAS